LCVSTRLGHLQQTLPLETQAVLNEKVVVIGLAITITALIMPHRRQ
jgi:hypothetical protein